MLDWDTIPFGRETDKAIAMRIGCSVSAVVRQRRRRGIDAKYKGGKPKADWDALPLGQVPDTHIAQQVGCSRERVRQHREKRGIPSHRSQQTTEGRFLRHTKSKGACLVWAGGGGFHIGTKTTAPARFAYEQFVGPVPHDRSVRPTCGNPACVRPAHLETYVPNTGLRKLTEYEAATIRRLYKEGWSCGKLSRAFGCHPVTASKIGRGLIYRDLTEEE